MQLVLRINQNFEILFSALRRIMKVMIIDTFVLFFVLLSSFAVSSLESSSDDKFESSDRIDDLLEEVSDSVSEYMRASVS